MFRQWLNFTKFIAFVCSVLLISCSATNVQNSNNPTKSSSPQNIQSAQRVVALTPLTADIIERLDKTKLVGIAGSSLLKEDPRFQNVTQVSEGQTPPNLEKIVALKPDLVIGAKGFSEQTLNKLKELEISTLSTEIKTWDSLLEITQKLAQIVGADPTTLLNKYQSFLTNIPQQNLSTLVLVDRKPILAPNKDSWAGSLLTKFNAKNLAAELQGKSPFSGYITLSPEKILQENPEIVLVVEAFGQKLLDEFKAEPFWKQLKATQSDRVYVFDYYGLINPGSIDKIEEACEKLKQAFAEKMG
jgi:iron complex transport system substrate-binding protein